MNVLEIKRLIQTGESETVELKTSLSDWKAIIESISAFANTNGGIVLIGVRDSSEIRGIKVGKDSIESLTNKIIQNTDPKIYASIEVAEVDGRDIIVLTVKDTQNKPYLAFGKAFKRFGKSTHQMSRDEYERMILEKHKEELRFDNRICERAGLEDIDKEKVKWFLRKAKAERNFDVEPETPVKEALDRLELVKNEKLTNAAILLFGKKPQKFFLQAETRCARFKGTKPVKPFLDMKVFEGSIIEQVDKTLNFVLEHIPMKVYLVGKAEREERYEYPPDAIREAIVNAICHRDYETSSNVQIRVFDDKIEVWGCGHLPDPLTPEDLKKKHKSILRNPLIGECFFLIKFIEKWGTGTNDMIDMCLDFGLPEPVFEHIAGDFVVTFRKPKLTDEYLDSLGLNNRQRKAIVYLMEHKKITKKEYMNLTNISKTPAFKDINGLLNKDVVVRKGSGRSAYYILQESVLKRPKKDRKKAE